MHFQVDGKHEDCPYKHDKAERKDALHRMIHDDGADNVAGDQKLQAQHHHSPQLATVGLEAVFTGFRAAGEYLVTGNNFDFTMYRDNILSAITDNYYNIPDWLPSGQCSFKEKYSL